ncbi:MAG: membrane dipeptidase [Pseudomonadota bacterium]
MGFIILLMLIGAALHWVAPGLVEGGMNENLPHKDYVINEEAQSLHRSLFVADLHADSLLWKRDLLKRSERGHLDLPRLLSGNVALQVFSATTKSPAGLNYEINEAVSDDITKLALAQFWPPATWTSLFARAEYQLDKLKGFADASEDRLRLITSAAELRALIKKRNDGDKVVGAVYLIEGAHPLEGKVDNLNRLFDQGLRVMGLVHFFDNELGGSLHGLSRAGLTEFGRAAVKRANELNVIIDVAHSSPKMVREVLELSTKPVILSHGGVIGKCDKNRNLSDELMRSIAEKGGLLGVGYWDGAVCDTSPEGIVSSIRYAIDLMGEDHVSLGSDYDGAVAVAVDTSELAVLTQTMLQQGFTEQEIRKVMGLNAQRFFLDNLPMN